jgi:hypothetical protein
MWFDALFDVFHCSPVWGDQPTEHAESGTFSGSVETRNCHGLSLAKIQCRQSKGLCPFRASNDKFAGREHGLRTALASVGLGGSRMTRHPDAQCYQCAALSRQNFVQPSVQSDTTIRNHNDPINEFAPEFDSVFNDD